MWKLFVRFRKRVILPIKWAFTKAKKVSEFKFPDDIDIYKKKEELEKELLEAERLKEDKKIEILKIKLELINWFIGK